MRRLVPTSLVITLLAIGVAFLGSNRSVSAGKPVQPPPIPQLYVADSTGQPVGAFAQVELTGGSSTQLPATFGAWVVVSTPYGNVPLRVQRDYLSIPAEGYITYDGFNCTGNAYIRLASASSTISGIAAITRRPQRTLWVATSPTAQSVAVCSRLVGDSECESGSLCGTDVGYPAVALFDPDTEFPPPYTLMQR